MTFSELKVGDIVGSNVIDLFTGDRDHRNEWADEAILSYDFVAGRQWSDDEVAKLRKEKRPVVTFNRTKTVIDAISGNEIGNRRQVRYIPRELGDVKANELYTSAGEWFRDRSHAEDAETDSFSDMLITGMGWTETRIDFEASANGDPVIDRIDPLEMFWDRNAKKRNITDAKRIWRVRKMPLSEAQSLIGGDQNFSAAQIDADWTNASEREDFGYNNEDHHDDSTGKHRDVTIVHVQWIERVNLVEVADPFTGQTEEFSAEEFTKLNERMMMLMGAPLQGKVIRQKRKQAFLGKVVLMVSDAPSQKGFTFNCLTGYRDRNKGLFFGMVRAMLDPQRWANKWLSQTMHILNTNAKGGMMLEKDAVDDMAAFERTWSDPSKPTVVKSGALVNGKIREKTSQTFPAGFQQLMEFGISSIRDTTGVSLEILGMREANQAASLEYQRRQSGMMILQPLFDALKLYREMQGSVMLEFIQKDLSDGRLIRIAGDGKEEYVRMMRQADVEYDIIVDDAPTSPNHKEMVWQMFMQLLPVLGKALPPPALIAMLEYSPLPSEVVDKMREMMSQPPSEEQQMQQQMEMVGAQQEIRKTASEATKNEASAQQMQAETQMSVTDFERQRLAAALLGSVPIAA
jgi:hypothetical protein